MKDIAAKQSHMLVIIMILCLFCSSVFATVLSPGKITTHIIATSIVTPENGANDGFQYKAIVKITRRLNKHPNLVGTRGEFSPSHSEISIVKHLKIKLNENNIRFIQFAVDYLRGTPYHDPNEVTTVVDDSCKNINGMYSTFLNNIFVLSYPIVVSSSYLMSHYTEQFKIEAIPDSDSKPIMKIYCSAVRENHT